MPKTHDGALVPGSSYLPAVIEQRTRIVNRVMGELTSRDTEAFFRRHPEFFRLVVSRYYPLREELIGRYENLWDWSLLSCNRNLLWNEDIIARFEDWWDWKVLSGNEALPWTENLIVKYQSSWNWGIKYNGAADAGLSLNKSLPWSKEFLDKFQNKLDWNWFCLLYTSRCV